MTSRKFHTRRLRERKQKKLYSEDLNFVDDELEAGRGFSLQEKLDSPKFAMEFLVREMHGRDLTIEYFRSQGFNTPILVVEKTGLGLCVPTQAFGVRDVRTCVGSRRTVDVMDVNTQKNSEMSMKDWARYYDEPNKNSLMNVISLEFSHTKLENYVLAPKIVRQIDWVDQVWPRHLKLQQVESTNLLNQMMYPKVQKYCLMSVKGCYTDFHIDFGGTSVWYHIVKGQKVFWLIPPTAHNLALYEKWVLSGKQADVFFGDSVEKCGRVHLTEGNTFFIPTGWIHAVYTPKDSLVFGGNFLHSFGIEMQLKIANVEQRTKVPQKFRYPFFNRMLWYVLDKYVYCFLGRTHTVPKDALLPIQVRHNLYLTKFEYDGLKAILYHLLSLPLKKLNTPPSMEEPSALIEDVRFMLKLHWNDEQALATMDNTIFNFYDDRFDSLPLKNEPNDDQVEYKNRMRCGKCEACQRECCGDCDLCEKREERPQQQQQCRLKMCQTPVLSAFNVCKFCENRYNTIDEPLMECLICKEIVHPICLENCEENNEDGNDDLNSKNGILNEDLPSSWECPRCTKFVRAANRVKRRAAVTGRRTKRFSTTAAATTRNYRNSSSNGASGRKRNVNDDYEDDGDDEYIDDASNSSSQSSAGVDGDGDVDDFDEDDVESEINDLVIGAAAVAAQTSNTNRDSATSDNENDMADDNGHDSDDLDEKKRGGVTNWKRYQEQSKVQNSSCDTRLKRNARRQQGSGAVAVTAAVSQRQQYRQQIVDEIVRSSTKLLRRPMYVVRPAEPPADMAVAATATAESSTECLLCVFRYLNERDLMRCALVCKKWSRLSIDPSLWQRIDLSFRKTLTGNLLKSIVRRRPQHLVFDWSRISKPALQWLLERVPNLVGLSLRGIAFETVAALSACSIPPLTYLDLSFVNCITDMRLRTILKPFNDARTLTLTASINETLRTRLRYLEVLKLAGADIADASLLYIVEELENLIELDLSSCARITDTGVAQLGLRPLTKLRQLNLSGSNLVTDTCLEYLRKCTALVRIDFRSCGSVTTSALIKFAAESPNSLIIQDTKLVMRQDDRI